MNTYKVTTNIPHGSGVGFFTVTVESAFTLEDIHDALIEDGFVLVNKLSFRKLSNGEHVVIRRTPYLLSKSACLTVDSRIGYGGDDMGTTTPCDP